MAALILLFSLLIPSIVFGGIDFEGVNGGDYCVYNGSESDFDPSSTVTIAAWIYKPAGDDWTLFAKRDEASDDRAYHFGVGATTSGNAKLYIFTDQGGTGDQWACRTTPNPIAADTWHYIIVQYDWPTSGCSNKFKVWVDGVSQSTENWFGTADFLTPPNTPENLYLGAIYDLTDGAEEFNGKMKNVAVWIDHKLTNDEANALYEGRFNILTPLQIAPSNLRALTLLPDVEEGIDADGKAFKNYAPGYSDFVCYDGANNTGLTSISEEHASFP